MEKLWLKNYPEGVPHDIFVSPTDTLVTLLHEAVEKFPDHIAFENFGATLTYRELATKSLQFACYLQNECGFKKGDRLSLMMPNLLQFPVALFGGLQAGMAIVNLNPLYTSSEVRHVLEDAQPSAIVVMENFAKTVEGAIISPLPTGEGPGERGNLNNIKVITTQIGDLMPFPKRTVFNFVLKYVKRKVPKHSLKDSVEFLSALKHGSSSTLKDVSLTGADLAFLQYTGGTTGLPKAAELSHTNLMSNITQAVSWVQSALREGEEKIIAALPMYHIFSLTICCFSFLKLGGEAILITNPRDLKGFVEELEKAEFSVFVGLNTLFNALMHNKKFNELDFSKLRLTISGGMALNKDVADHWQQLTGQPVLEGYGLTEASPVVSVNPTTVKGFTGSIGLPLPGTDISIRDPEGNEVGLAEEGELWVKGPQVMKRYWRNPEETAKVLKDGWLKTGDVVKIDEDGMLYLVDRLKDMILVSGFNVYPNEVEEALMMHPDIKEVGVVGIKDEHAGEAVKAFVVLEEGAELSKGDIIHHCKKYLTGYKLPKHIELKDELPKTSVGKILRRELRE